jgi:3-oxosteroid 1-dehydrogenase
LFRPELRFPKLNLRDPVFNGFVTFKPQQFKIILLILRIIFATDSTSNKFVREEDEVGHQVVLMIYDQRTKDLFASGAGGYPVPAPGTNDPIEMSGQTIQELGQKIRARISQIAGRLGAWRLDDAFETNLQATITKFNGFANSGNDTDFHRGSFPYDVEWHKGVFSIPATGTKWPANDKPNITMYPFTATGPYYCIFIAGGTLDTNDGPKINEMAQVLDTKETPIPGLYGAGNCIAAPMPYYIAGGSTLGNALTFGYVAGVNAVKEPVK